MCVQLLCISLTCVFVFIPHLTALSLYFTSHPFISSLSHCVIFVHHPPLDLLQLIPPFLHASSISAVLLLHLLNSRLSGPSPSFPPSIFLLFNLPLHFGCQPHLESSSTHPPVSPAPLLSSFSPPFPFYLGLPCFHSSISSLSTHPSLLFPHLTFLSSITFLIFDSSAVSLLNVSPPPPHPGPPSLPPLPSLPVLLHSR